MDYKPLDQCPILLTGMSPMTVLIHLYIGGPLFPVSCFWPFPAGTDTTVCPLPWTGLNSGSHPGACVITALMTSQVCPLTLLPYHD